jgi:glycosyltransferase involved in cell wall biosynthesis
MITFAPSRAKPMAMASPIPFVDPETSASLFESCKSIEGQFCTARSNVKSCSFEFCAATNFASILVPLEINLLVVKCAAVIPCFNEDKTIASVVLTLRRHLDVVVVVDDGSTDKTALRAEDAGALVIRHEYNRGKGAALQTGLSQLLSLGFEWGVTLDGDGQHLPADIPAFLRCAELSDALLIIGNRMHNPRAMPWLRRRVNRWMSRKLSQYAGCHLPDTQSGFRLVNLQTWASLRLSAQYFEIESEMLIAFLMDRHAVEFVPIHSVASTRKSHIHPVVDSLRWWKWWRKMKKSFTRLPDIEIGSQPCTTIAQKL